MTAACALCGETAPSASMVSYGFRPICPGCVSDLRREDIQREREQAWTEEEARELADFHAGRNR